MAKKIIKFFFVILTVFFSFTSIPFAGAEELSIDKAKKTVESLQNIEKTPIIEDISLIASTVRSTQNTYRSIKTKISNAIDYGKKIVQTTKEVLGKIESSGHRIKKYIEDKIDLITLRYEINPFLI